MLGVSEDVADWLAVPDADAPCDNEAVAVVEKDGEFVPVVVVLGVCMRAGGGGPDGCSSAQSRPARMPSPRAGCADDAL